MKKTLMILMALAFALSLTSVPAFAIEGDDDDDFVGETYYFCPGDRVVWLCHVPGSHSKNSSNCYAMPSAGATCNYNPMLVGFKACDKGHRKTPSQCNAYDFYLECGDFYDDVPVEFDDECDYPSYDACCADNPGDPSCPPP